MPDKAFNLSNSLRAKKAAGNNYLVGYGWNEMGGGDYAENQVFIKGKGEFWSMAVLWLVSGS